MARYRRRETKEADGGACVVLYEDINDGSWFIGRIGDPVLDPLPLGAFSSAEAARRWADVQFQGGQWRPGGDA